MKNTTTVFTMPEIMDWDRQLSGVQWFGFLHIQEYLRQRRHSATLIFGENVSTETKKTEANNSWYQSQKAKVGTQ